MDENMIRHTQVSLTQGRTVLPVWVSL